MIGFPIFEHQGQRMVTIYIYIIRKPKTRILVLEDWSSREGSRKENYLTVFGNCELLIHRDVLVWDMASP